jgi:hypothetical protein
MNFKINPIQFFKCAHRCMIRVYINDDKCSYEYENLHLCEIKKSNLCLVGGGARPLGPWLSLPQQTPRPRPPNPAVHMGLR